MINIIGYGNHHLLPALCVGFEIEPQDSKKALDLREVPPWAFLFEHQAGGHRCINVSIVGAALRLEANIDKGGRNLDELIHSLRSIGEYSSSSIKEKSQDLQGLASTFGEEYTGEQILFLETWLTRFLSLPPIERGIEACITFKRSDLLKFLEGWRVMHGSGVTPLEPVLSGLKQVIPEEVEQFAPDLLANIGAFWRTSLGLQGVPKLYLLWENSD